MEWYYYWILGFTFSLGIGHCFTKWFVNKIREKTGCATESDNWKNYIKYSVEVSSLDDKKNKLTYNEPVLKDLSPGLQGLIERLFFTIVIAFSIPGAAVSIMAWFAVKMITNLNRGDLPPKKIARMRAFTGLQGALVSMIFALIGGLICWYNNPFLK